MTDLWPSNFKLPPGGNDEEPHAHILHFESITNNQRYPDVPNTTIKLLLFPFSLDGVAKTWLDKEPPNSILTWDYLVSKFINFFFPPSKTTNLRNEITNFRQIAQESFSEAWERFKELLRKCPHHGFSLMHQLDTFYNSLSYNDQDSLNSAAGGNFLYKSPTEGLQIIENKAKVRCSRNAVMRVSTNAPPSSSTSSSSNFEFQQMAAALEDKMTLTFRNEMNEMKNMMKALVPTPLGGGPRCQETMGGIIAQTRFENVSKLSNDSLLARSNTLQSDEDSLKLNELMELFNVQDDANNEIFDVDTLIGDEVFAEQEVAAKGVNLTVDKVTLAQALAALKSVKPKVKGDGIKEPSVPVSAASASIKAKVQDKGKGIMVEPKPVKPTKKKVQIMLDKEIALKLQEDIDEEERITRAEEENIDEANIAWDDIQAKVDVDY
ncbi:reverse transcriptase domain-containing protein [Tanacetum coccineum]